MSHFLRIQHTMIHVPSLSGVNVFSGCMGKPSLIISYHTQKIVKIQYSNWDTCEKDLNRIKDAMKRVEVALEGLPITEEKLTVTTTSSEVVVDLNDSVGKSS